MVEEGLRIVHGTVYCVLIAPRICDQEASRVSQPLLLGWVVGYVGRESALPPTRAYLYGFGLCCMLLLHGVLGTAYLFVTQRVALKMKTALEALLYRKVVSLSCEAALLTSPAVVVEQFSTNTDVFAEVRGISLFLYFNF